MIDPFPSFETFAKGVHEGEPGPRRIASDKTCGHNSNWKGYLRPRNEAWREITFLQNARATAQNRHHLFS
jgi:hypothetical protein